MSMFSGSRCSDCYICRYESSCLARNGDDDFIVATNAQVIERLNNGRYPHYREEMKEFLLSHYGYEYEEE